MHPLFRDNEKQLLKKLRRQLKVFELCIRNFEITYIEMIKDLQNKTFKLNLDGNHDRSIIMKKRETAINHNKIFTTKLLDNQMFDVDGNILLTNSSSLKNSFNQSNFLNNMLLQTNGMPP